MDHNRFNQPLLRDTEVGTNLLLLQWSSKEPCTHFFCTWVPLLVRIPPSKSMCFYNFDRYKLSSKGVIVMYLSTNFLSMCPFLHTLPTSIQIKINLSELHYLIGKKWYLYFCIWNVLLGGWLSSYAWLVWQALLAFVAISSSYFQRAKQCTYMDICWFISFWHLLPFAPIHEHLVHLWYLAPLHVFFLPFLLLLFLKNITGLWPREDSHDSITSYYSC